jgi:hypothetical protein
VNHHEFIKKLATPAEFNAPERLRFEHLEARAITRADLADDVRGINSSLELIARTRGGGWPTEPVTEAGNFVDLVWHELEFRDGYSFTYAVYDAGGTYLGCCYLYPLGRRTELSEALLDYDVDVSWWVTPAAHERGDYEKLYAALQRWLATEFPFWRPYYSNREMPPEPPGGSSTRRMLGLSGDCFGGTDER